MTTLLAEMTPAEILEIQNYCKVIHIVGAFMLIAAMGILVTKRKGDSGRGVGVVFHGAGLVILLLAGFAWLGFDSKMAKINPGFEKRAMTEIWVLAKMGVWVVFGISIMLANKGILFRGALGVLVTVILGAVAIAMAVMKPYRPAPEAAEPAAAIESLERSGIRQNSDELL